jgi:hypothetical protein
MANLVLVGYVVAAFREDAGEIAAGAAPGITLQERRKDR